MVHTCSLSPCNPVSAGSNPPFLQYSDADSRAIVNFWFVFFLCCRSWEKGNFVSIRETKSAPGFETNTFLFASGQTSSFWLEAKMAAMRDVIMAMIFIL